MVARLMAAARRDPLGVPELDAEARDGLLRSFAPVWEIETAGDDDRIGTLAWSDAPSRVVAVDRPVAYRRLTYTRFGGEVLIQLVYPVWFPQRPATSTCCRAGSTAWCSA